LAAKSPGKSPGPILHVRVPFSSHSTRDESISLLAAVRNSEIRNENTPAFRTGVFVFQKPPVPAGGRDHTKSRFKKRTSLAGDAE
jgi:hypothetical protein